VCHWLRQCKRRHWRSQWRTTVTSQTEQIRLPTPFGASRRIGVCARWRHGSPTTARLHNRSSCHAGLYVCCLLTDRAFFPQRAPTASRRGPPLRTGTLWTEKTGWLGEFEPLGPFPALRTVASAGYGDTTWISPPWSGGEAALRNLPGPGDVHPQHPVTEERRTISVAGSSCFAVAAPTGCSGTSDTPAILRCTERHRNRQDEVL
jgi:hypothetical protein